jgi:hypothetical protein
LGVKLRDKRKRSFIWGLIICAVTVIAFFSSPIFVGPSKITADAANESNLIEFRFRATENMYNQFGSNGIFIRRAQNADASNKTYYGTVNAVIENAGGLEIATVANAPNYNAQYSALVMRDGIWEPASLAEFWLDYNSDPSNLSIVWKLAESAPANNYAVQLVREDDKGAVFTYTYQVLYTEAWTYVSLHDGIIANNGGSFDTVINGFYGGERTKLTVFLESNNGATVLSSLTEKGVLDNGVSVGNIASNQIINASTLSVASNISISIMGGGEYTDIRTDAVGNQVDILFNTPLEDKIYIVKFRNNLDNTVYGTLIINNVKDKNIYLSKAWVALVVLGSILVVLIGLVYFVPFVVRYVNGRKVYNETERINRQKNPEEYADEGSGSGSGKEDSPFAKLKKGFARNKARKAAANGVVMEDSGPKLEPEAAAERKPKEDLGHKRFTEAIRDKRERREFAKQQGLSEDDLVKIEKEHTEFEQAKKDSFAFLRDDDEPIATVKKEAATDRSINAGAVEIGGAVFTPLSDTDDGAAENFVPTADGMASAINNKEDTGEGEESGGGSGVNEESE